MSKNEIRGLQSLAKAHGGSLTKNPETGLYEAGFLEQILPIVAAGAAMYFTAGAATPMLMSAGMGATSAGILAGAGAGALIGGGSAAIQGGDVGKGALMGGLTGAVGGGISAGIEGLSATPTVDQATAIGTNAVNVNPATGAPIDPMAGLAGAPTPTPGANAPQVNPNMGSGYSQVGQAPQLPANAQAPIPGIDNPALNIPQPGISNLTSSPSTQAPTTPMADGRTANQIAGDKILKQQADAVAAAKANPDSSWWAKQTPLEKAGYTTAGAGILAAMNAPKNTVPGTDTSDDGAYLRRISPNFRAQAPIQPNPYYRAQYPTYAAEGGIMRLAGGGMTNPGPVEQMTQNTMGGQGNMFPQSQQEHTNFATPTQMPASAEIVRSDYDTKTQPYTGVMMAEGGITDLGSYSDGGRLLKGPGDGVSDNIPATIGGHQPARLADGEFVVPARIVSELGNGSTDAGAKRLYAMMERVQAKRKKSMGKGKFAVNSKADKDLPA